MVKLEVDLTGRLTFLAFLLTTVTPRLPLPLTPMAYFLG